MRFLSSDLFRNFGIGFVIGTALIVGAKAEEFGPLASPAQAAEMIRADAPAPEFVIAPEGR
jgi:hypothetical protein